MDSLKTATTMATVTTSAMRYNVEQSDESSGDMAMIWQEIWQDDDDLVPQGLRRTENLSMEERKRRDYSKCYE